ncbi:hypothetical protein MRB53_030330 [Persea americana]|uniref:Uncharacterized protein n=1 Tax=Persea americana TaxID=3435 RepID=A0ACC2KL77_PERAE|nr:hypothetical protein MRB53_030330 [Persea americana]
MMKIHPLTPVQPKRPGRKWCEEGDDGARSSGLVHAERTGISISRDTGITTYGIGMQPQSPGLLLNGRATDQSAPGSKHHIPEPKHHQKEAFHSEASSPQISCGNLEQPKAAVNCTPIRTSATRRSWQLQTA